MEILRNPGICSGCKQEIKEKLEEDRCKIRQCTYRKGYNTCWNKAQDINHFKELAKKTDFDVIKEWQKDEENK